MDEEMTEGDRMIADAVYTRPETTHTSGPWRVILTMGSGEPFVRLGDYKHMEYTDVEAARGCTLTPADARLIAAAPDLLGQLRVLVLLHRNYTNGHITRSEWIRAMDDAADFAEQAIAKATTE